MTLTVAQSARMQCEIPSGSTWEQRTAQVPDTPEARELWHRMAQRIAAHVAAGHQLDVLSND